MTTTTETAPATDIGTDNLSPEIAPEPLTLTEFIAAQLRSKHILDGRWVQMSATADGTRIDIDIEHPFPPARHLRVVAHLEVVVPDDEPAAQDGVEIGATA